MKKLFAKITAVLTAAVMTVTAAVFPVYAEDIKIPDNDATRFVDALGAGWNLGNTFDAANCTWLSDELEYETAWCGTKTTKELIKAIKKLGFSSIRLPVSWHDHVDKKLTISSKWLARYKEVVDWCINEGLYVIINTHHDVEKGYYYPSSSELSTSTKFMTKIWEQLSDTFKNYDEKLIFSSINEPRLAGTEYEWYFNTWSVPNEAKDSIECINKLNQTFVDTVRKSGGNNKSRYLLVGGYATSEGDIGLMSPYFKMPTDTVKNRLIADVHYYCSDLKFDRSFLDKLYKSFVAKGVPVIMSELGLRVDYNTEGFYLHDRAKESADKLGEIAAYARKCGISCFFWDNNSGSKGKYGFKIIDRVNAKADIPEIVNALVSGGKPAFLAASSDAKTQTVSKPKVKATAYKTKVKLTWNKADGAAKYAVYQYKNGKYTKIKTVTGTSATVKSLKSGKTYKFIVRAYVNGKWTSMKTTDAVKVTTKK